MVLQRGQAVPVWGTAEAGTTVAVEFAEQKKTTKADAGGRWQVALDPLTASAQPQILQVSSPTSQVSFSDVLVGEVWLCGGQSNMDFALKQLTGKAREPQYEPVAEYLRKEVETANDPLLRHFKVARQVRALEERTDASGVWKLAVSGQVQDFSGTGYFFGRELRRELDVPVALLSCNWGGTLVEPWIPQFAFEKDAALEAYYEEQHVSLKQNVAKWDESAAKAKYDKQLEVWKLKAAQAKATGKKSPRKPKMQQSPQLSNRIPSTLYNGMMHSLVPYGIKGAIWYQGESNAKHFPEAYEHRFSTLIDAWRERWGQEQLYFYWCQLAKYKAPAETPVGDDDGWVQVCDAQRRTLSKPDTGMAVLNDIGEAKDIHPKNKVDAGKRLALWAMKQAYGKDIVCSGPLYKSSEIKDGKVVVTFDSVGAGLMVGKKHLMAPTVEVDEPLKRFQICGADQQWKWANAKIIATDRVAVWHPEIAEPVEVRYAWSANAEGANLYNRDGLPAAMFKTR